MKHVQSAGGIVVGPEGKILVVINEIGTRTFPKGTLKHGETPLEAARREIKEETGLGHVTVGRKLGIITRPGYSATNRTTPSAIKHIHMYFCATTESVFGALAADVLKAEWVKPEEVSGSLSHQGDREFFERLLAAGFDLGQK